MNTETDTVRGQGGEQMAEEAMDANGNMAWQHTNVWANGTLIGTYDNNGLHFYLNDWLGTRRVQTDYEGVTEQTCSSLPYGNGETCIPFPTEHLFTGKERDSESGNDYFIARYYGSSMARFLSADDGTDQDSSDPQSWNLYSYAHNSPLVNTDPDGHDCVNQSAVGTNYIHTDGATTCPDGYSYVDGNIDTKSLVYHNGVLSFNISNYADGSGTAGSVFMTVGNQADPDTLKAGVFGSPSAQTWTNANGAVTDATIGVAAVYGTLGAAAFMGGGGGAAVALRLAPMGRVAAATLAGGWKVGQQMARTGATSPAALLDFAKSAMTNAVQAGTTVQATFGTIYRDGGNYIVQNAQGVITSVVVNAEAGKGIVSTYFDLGGK